MEVLTWHRVFGVGLVGLNSASCALQIARSIKKQQSANACSEVWSEGIAPRIQATFIRLIHRALPLQAPRFPQTSPKASCCHLSLAGAVWLICHAVELQKGFGWHLSCSAPTGWFRTFWRLSGAGFGKRLGTGRPRKPQPKWIKPPGWTSQAILVSVAHLRPCTFTSIVAAIDRKNC